MDKKKLVQEGFDAGAKVYQEKFKNQEAFEDSLKLFFDELPKQNPTVLDLGCGPGNISAYLLEWNKSMNLIGVDISRKMIELARESNPKATFIQEDALEYLVYSEKVDGIMSGFLLPYLEKDAVEKLIQRASKLLDIRGVLYLSTMEGDYKDSRLIGPSKGNGLEIFIHYHEEEYLRNYLIENGFLISDIRRKEYVFTSEITNVDLIIVATKSSV